MALHIHHSLMFTFRINNNLCIYDLPCLACKVNNFNGQKEFRTPFRRLGWLLMGGFSCSEENSFNGSFAIR